PAPSPPTPQPPAKDEIRMVSILFADMSHSVETTWDLQPEETAELVNRLLEVMVAVLLKYEARVDRFLGDGLLAVFGVPHLHEDDPERAVRAALEIQSAAQELALGVTIGINTGPVYFGRMGSEAHQEITVMGPAVNLAARLQGQAETGQILVGAVTYRQTQRAFRFRPHSVAIKGIPEPVQAYEAVRLRRRPQKSYGLEGLRAELIGRDEELGKLKAVLAQLRQGGGQMVSLIGEAGVGKSRLVAELKPLAQQTLPPDKYPISNPQSPIPHLLWLEGRCLEMNQSTSYWPFVDIFHAYFAWGPEDEEPSRAERLVVTLQKMVARGDLSAEQLEELGPLLGHLLSLRFGNDWDERLKNASPEQIRHQTFMAARDFFVALARPGPLILVLEDLHWADSLSLDLISLLMETLASASLLLLCVYRPEREHKCWHLAAVASRKCPARFTELRLRELTPQESRRLIESLLVIEDLPP
ncbi:MAG: AAA family ATPase, partial [Anaerolineae bacterium]|nr:AAA family ATPase [Anaerolineae bacterium]